MDKETTKMIPGDELHLTMLMAPYSLNLVTGQDRQHLLAFGRAAFEAGKADRPGQCLHHIAEPETAASMLRQCIDKATFPTNMDKHSALQWIDQLEAEVDAERRHHGIRNASAVRTLHALGYSWGGTDSWRPPAQQAVQAAVPEGWKLVPIKPTPEMCHVGRYGGDKDAPAYGEKPVEGATAWPFVADHTAEQIYQSMLAAAPAHLAEGVQTSASGEDVTVTQPPEWMLIHKETGAQKPLDSQWTVRAAQPAAQGMATTGYIAPKGRYVPPVLFSPYTGEPRDARDIASDPHGILIVPPGAALAATQPAAQGMEALTPAARDVLAERKRQIETEGWKPVRDDVYDTGEMALAAACYAAHSASCAAIKAPHTARGVFVRTRSAQDFVGEMWPWSADWWKPSGHRRNLEKAAALILAEIERIDRAALAAQAKQGGA